MRCQKGLRNAGLMSVLARLPRYMGFLGPPISPTPFEQAAWYLTTSLKDAKGTARGPGNGGGSIRASRTQRNTKNRFRLSGRADRPAGAPSRLPRVLMALALTWLSLADLPEVGRLPGCWHSAIVQGEKRSFCVTDRSCSKI